MVSKSNRMSTVCLLFAVVVCVFLGQTESDVWVKFYPEGNGGLACLALIDMSHGHDTMRYDNMFMAIVVGLLM